MQLHMHVVVPRHQRRGWGGRLEFKKHINKLHLYFGTEITHLAYDYPPSPTGGQASYDEEDTDTFPMSPLQEGHPQRHQHGRSFTPPWLSLP